MISKRQQKWADEQEAIARVKYADLFRAHGMAVRRVITFGQTDTYQRVYYGWPDMPADHVPHMGKTPVYLVAVDRESQSLGHYGPGGVAIVCACADIWRGNIEVFVKIYEQGSTVFQTRDPGEIDTALAHVRLALQQPRHKPLGVRSLLAAGVLVYGD